MSLLGIDVGTGGCKAGAFTHAGELLASAYEEYAVRTQRPGQAELDAPAVWQAIGRVIARVAAATGGDPITALSVSSLGEAVVPVTRDRKIIGPSLLNFDARGAEYLPGLTAQIDDAELYTLTGNTLGNHFALTKLMWLRDHAPTEFGAADYYLPWSTLVGFMLGGEAQVDYASANRCLGLDLDCGAWSTRVLDAAGIDASKLPRPVPSGSVIGVTGGEHARELGLPLGIPIVAGAHDQCLNALGCGVIAAGQAMYGIGTYICIVPVFAGRPAPASMMTRGLNTEHHVVPGQFVCFIYNQGGALLRWMRDLCSEAGGTSDADRYTRLLDEMPAGPSGLTVLPHFMATGAPDFISDSCGMIAGLQTSTTRGAMLKGLLEGVTYYFRESLDRLPAELLDVREFRATGGGSRSPQWLQLTADLLGRPVAQPRVTEAGLLGAALLAGMHSGVYADAREAVGTAVQIERVFEPDAAAHAASQPYYEHYRATLPVVREYLQALRRIQIG